MDRFARAGLHFDVRDAGPPDGEVVVCLHGFPQDSSAFDRLTPRLTARGLRVLSPDQRGYSPGARPAPVSAYVLRELVDDVLALLDAAGAPAAHVVGHDWGGIVAWALAGRHPGRVASLTVLGTPHPAAMRRAVLHSTQAARSWYMGAFQVPRLPEALLLGAGGAGLRALLRRGELPPSAAERYLRRMREPGALAAAISWYRALPRDPGYRIGRAGVSTAYLWGARDPFFSRTAVKGTWQHVDGPFAARRLDAGHWLPETRPDDVARAVLSLVGAPG